MRWSLDELVAAAGVDAHVEGSAVVRGLSYDTRHVRDGDLFCCIPGTRADGHDYAPEAVERGAAALVVERSLPVAVPQARVRRVRAALGPLADAFFGRPSRSLQVAGVTGTNGKTTVTYLLEAMVRAAGRTPGVIGTVESRVAGRAVPSARTTPESVDLQRLLHDMRAAGCDVVAMEVTSHALDQGRVDATWFAAAGFTNLTQDHLDYHGSIEEYFRAKALLFHPRFTSKAVVNGSDPRGRELAAAIEGMEVWTYGWSDEDIACVRADVRPEGTVASIRTPAGTGEVALRLVGRYNVDNLLCAAGLALSIGVGLAAVVEGAESVERVPGRLERIEWGGEFTVLVDYAHTPDALSQALRASRELTEGRVIVVFGCGGDRDRGKRPLMGAEATRSADLTVITSDNPRSEDPLAIIDEIRVGAQRGEGRWRVEPDRRAAIAAALVEARPGDVVLVAGKGHELGQQLASVTLPFDDREVARELLRRREVAGA